MLDETKKEGLNEVEETAAEPMESMDDYKEELEASFQRIYVGDMLTGTVIDVTDEQVVLDLKSYAEGVIPKENMSDDPDFNMKESVHVGDEISATVVKRDDGQGNLLLSRKEANNILAWDKLETLMQERTIVPVKVQQVVNGGVVAYLEGIRGFIPASRLDADYVENLQEWEGKTVDVTVITANPEEKRLVLSGREAAREKKEEAKKKKIAKCQVGAVMNGKVESLQTYGAFVELENGLTGLLHISQISEKRLRHPKEVLKVGQDVRVRILSTDNNKISLSMKEMEQAQEEDDTFDYHESGEATTSLGDLFKNWKR
ncbi:MAG: S1 RNA-binding domain-containing protein [bacterium]|nr:S1 RNA-binding domain-containing protein [bacterium]